MNRTMRTAARRRRHATQPRDAGMSTAEYAIGTVAACGFAGLLLKILTGDEVAGLIRSVVRHALSFAF